MRLARDIEQTGAALYAPRLHERTKKSRFEVHKVDALQTQALAQLQKELQINVTITRIKTCLNAF